MDLDLTLHSKVKVIWLLQAFMMEEDARSPFEHFPSRAGTWEGQQTYSLNQRRVTNDHKTKCLSENAHTDNP